MKLFAALYLDEDVNVLVGTLLIAQGFDVVNARDEGMLGKSDEEQLAHTIKLDRCILTHNRSDFETIHTEYISIGKTHAGIMLARRRQTAYEIVKRVVLILNKLTADEITGQILCV
jgi:predicted nuclease of predicted toxin-antitoxin system